VRLVHPGGPRQDNYPKEGHPLSPDLSEFFTVLPSGTFRSLRVPELSAILFACLEPSSRGHPVVPERVGVTPRRKRPHSRLTRAIALGGQLPLSTSPPSAPCPRHPGKIEGKAPFLLLLDGLRISALAVVGELSDYRRPEDQRTSLSCSQFRSPAGPLSRLCTDPNGEFQTVGGFSPPTPHQQ